MISQTKIEKFIKLAKNGASYKEFWKVDNFSLIPVNKFYDIRRNILKNTIETQIPDYLEKCELMTTHFKIFHHWQMDNVIGVKNSMEVHLLQINLLIYPLLLT